MVFARLANWFSPTISNELVDDDKRAGKPSMESVGSLPVMRKEKIQMPAAAEADEEETRPPYSHVRAPSGA